MIQIYPSKIFFRHNMASKICSLNLHLKIQISIT